ncbi:uncharacterized protein L201_007902 [Kwoniella dendrophila CBS 6074]|uniref:Dienelactone hydrolase domain-containing protein n=1 Tax=Kwoniella dendrophila CBS 6074 TaxID=1295534 RepID=A0AAX4K6B5_9TREE
MTFLPLSPCCLQGGKLIGEPRGKFVPANPANDNGHKVSRYHTIPSYGKVINDKVALVLFTDAFGLTSSNPKIIADEFANQLKINVFVPEYIVDPPPIDVYDPVAPLYPDQYNNRSWSTSIYMIGEVLWKTWRWLPMLFFPKKQVPLAQAAIDDLTEEGYEKLIGIGYCRGGAVLQYLLADESKNVNLIGGIINHPSTEKETWSKINQPTLWNLADHDQMFSLKDIDHLKDVFGKRQINGNKKLDFQCNVYENTVHGFACRPTLDHEPTKKAFDQANSSAVEFCRKYLF